MNLLTQLMQGGPTPKAKGKRGFSEACRRARNLALRKATVENFKAVMQGAGELSTRQIADRLGRFPNSVTVTLRTVLAPAGYVIKTGTRKSDCPRPRDYWLWK